MLKQSREVIREPAVRDALTELILRARRNGVPVRCGNHGYMNPVFTFAPHGTRCPAVVVNPRRLTWYYEPRQHFPIFSVRDIPDDLLGG